MGLSTRADVHAILDDPVLLGTFANYTLEAQSHGSLLVYCSRCKYCFGLPDLPGDVQDLCLASVIIDIFNHEIAGDCDKRIAIQKSLL